MANSLVVNQGQAARMPSAIGLMGGGRRLNSLLPFLLQGQPGIADAADEAMFARAAQGYAETPQGYAPIGAPMAAPVMPQAPAERERVNPLNVLFRGLAPNLSGALDTERTRLQAEADRPQALAIKQENERIARALGPQALLAFRSNPEAFGESVGYQYRPQTVAEGSLLSIPGMGTTLNNERRAVVGDRVVGLGTPGQGPRELLTVTPSFSDTTARINATNPVNVAQDARLVDPYSGRVVAEGIQRPDIQNVAPGGEALAFDSAGNIINRVGSTQVKPMSDADQKAVAEAEARLARIDNATGRAQNIISQIDAGELNLGPVSNFTAGIRNATGRSNANSLNYNDLKNWAEEARNEILQSANGVQTEGDALRALNTILSGTNDERIVKQALERYVASKAGSRAVFERDIARRSATQSTTSNPYQSNAPAPPPGFVLD